MSAKQSYSQEALQARDKVSSGATLFRGGTLGKSQTTGVQFWSLENHLTPGYASKMRIPPENCKSPDFVESGTLKEGMNFVTRKAPGVGTNNGGGIEVVVPSGGVKVNTFNTNSLEN